MSEPGRYQLGREIGRGGLGRVVEAVDVPIGRTVALKLLLDGAPLDLVQRFEREGRITGRLEHPNIVPVHEVGVLPGVAGRPAEVFFAMKKISGRDMAEVIEDLRKGRPPEPGHAAGREEWTQRRLVEALRDASRAMAYAHSKGVIHRDLKPSNVMLGEFGEVLVVDWGLAREKGSALEKPPGATTPEPRALSPSLTLDGDIFGTPEYMPPEQAEGRMDEVDERSDVWSLGAILYEILTWHPPFTGASSEDVLRKVVSEAVTAPSTMVGKNRSPVPETGWRPRFAQPPPVPPDLEAICLRAMAREKQDRYPDAGGFAAELDAWLEGSRERQRREAAARESLKLAGEKVAEWKRLSGEAAVAAVQAVEADDAIDWHDPLEKKRPFWELEDRVERLKTEAVEAFAAADAALSAALSSVPGMKEARKLKAELYWERFLEAEAAGDGRGALLSRRVVEANDDGSCAELLRGDGTLTIETQAYRCRCLVSPREIDPAELNVRGFHPWSGRRLTGSEAPHLPELERGVPASLKVHRADCAPSAIEGAAVWAFRYESIDRALVPVTPDRSERPIPEEILNQIWGDSPYRPRGGGLYLGMSPLRDLRWPMGSWVLVIAAEGRVPAVVPAFLPRGGRFEGRVTLYTRDEIPAGFTLIPGGSFPFQGDRESSTSARGVTAKEGDAFLSRFPVTCREYLGFLNDVWRSDPSAALAHVPRESVSSIPCWPLVEGHGYAIPTSAFLEVHPDLRPGTRLRFCETDWCEDWPVLSVTWDSAQAFALWASRRTGCVYALPTESLWEKAARGADARFYPFGNVFDATRCNVGVSLPPTPHPCGVREFPGDESPYGICGLAGNSADYCLDDSFGTERRYRSVRGGSWHQAPLYARSAYRSGATLGTPNSRIGIRLVRYPRLRT